MSARRPKGSIFAVPSILAAATVTGLIGALLFEGAFDYAWTILIAVPLLTIVWKFKRA